MTIEQTRGFKMEVEHYTNLAKEWMYTTRKDEVKNSIYRMEKMRGREYTNKVIAKCNQKLKVKFYEKIA